MTADQVIENGCQLDIDTATGVDITVREDGRTIWVNVDGVCVLRVSRIRNPPIIDNKMKVREEPHEAVKKHWDYGL